MDKITSASLLNWSLTKIFIRQVRQGEQLAGGAKLGGGEQAAAGQQARHRDPGGQAKHRCQQDPALQGKYRHVSCELWKLKCNIFCDEPWAHNIEWINLQGETLCELAMSGVDNIMAVFVCGVALLLN